ncbi:MAG: TVP38/TMEM64 family protein [Actinomycetota bacterium]
MRKRTGGDYLKLVAFLLLVAAAAYLLFFTPAGDLFRTHRGRKALVGKLDVLVQAAGPLGPVLFILIYTIGVLFLPASPFTAAGAVIFGKFYGMLYNLAADTLGACVAFYLGRYFLHGVARGFLETRMPWLDRKAEEEGFSVIFYLRIFWFPFIVLNYAAGATRIRFRDYFLGTVLGLIPAVFLFTYFVGSMKEVLATYRRPADLLTFDLILPVLLLVLSFFLPALLKRLRKDRELLPPGGDDPA